jgi:hypothetical protein
MSLFYLAVAIQLAILAGAIWAMQRLDLAKLRAESIDVLGNFMADILDHPRVKIALAQAVTNGINHTMEQPDLGGRLHKVSESMRADNLQMSRSLGEQLPGLAKHFFGGAVSSISKKTKNENTKALEPKKMATEVSNLSLDFSESDLVDTKKIK